MYTNLLTSVLGSDCTHEMLGHTPHYPLDLDSQAVHRVFVHLSDTRQLGHDHHFSDIDRFGDGLCHPCGAAGWSPGWVRQGVMSGHTASGTTDWITESIDWRCARLERDRQAVTFLVEEPLTVPVVAIEHDGQAPARRPGIPVPQMAYGVLTVQS